MTYVICEPCIDEKTAHVLMSVLLIAFTHTRQMQLMNLKR